MKKQILPYELRTVLIGFSLLSFIIGNIAMALIPGAFIFGVSIVLLSVALLLSNLDTPPLFKRRVGNEYRIR